MKDFFAQLGRLLHFELRKLFRRKTLYFAMAIMFITAFSVVITQVEVLRSEDMEFLVSSVTFGNMLAVVLAYLYNSSLTMLCFFGAIIVGLVFCEDYSKGTIKLIVGRGYEKTAIYSAKAIIVLFCSVMMGIVAPFAGVILGTTFSGVRMSTVGFGKAMAESNALVSVAMFFATMFIFMLLGVLVKKSGAVIAICIGATYVLEIVIVIIEIVMQFGDVGYEVMAKTLATIAKTFPLFYTAYTSSVSVIFSEFTSVNMNGAYIGAAVWIVIAAALGALVAHKRDC